VIAFPSDEEVLRLREENRRLKAALDLIFRTSQRQKIIVDLATRNVKVCKHVDCDNRARSQGYCDTCYRRVRRLERQGVAA
jgi:cell shape-determining protein MreC